MAHFKLSNIKGIYESLSSDNPDTIGLQILQQSFNDNSFKVHCDENDHVMTFNDDTGHYECACQEEYEK